EYPLGEARRDQQEDQQMSYPGSPTGDERPNEQQYGYPAYPTPSSEPAPSSPVYGQPAQPVSPAYGQPQQPVSPAYGQPTPDYGAPGYGQPIPPQPVPVPDQHPAFAAGTAPLPAYGYDNPMSGPPVSPSPIMAPSPAYGVPLPPAQPAKKRGMVVPLLASLLALAVITAGIFVGLYVDKSGKLDKSRQLAGARRETISTARADLRKTKKELETKSDELTKAQQDLRGTQNDNAQTKSERDVIAKCLTLLTQALQASARGDSATMNSKINEMREPCNKAYSITGI